LARIGDLRWIGSKRPETDFFERESRKFRFPPTDGSGNPRSIHKYCFGRQHFYFWRRGNRNRSNQCVEGFSRCIKSKNVPELRGSRVVGGDASGAASRQRVSAFI